MVEWLDDHDMLSTPAKQTESEQSGGH